MNKGRYILRIIKRYELEVQGKATLNQKKKRNDDLLVGGYFGRRVGVGIVGGPIKETTKFYHKTSFERINLFRCEN